MTAREIAQTARKVAPLLATAPTQQKNRALQIMAEKLSSALSEILSANQADMERAKQKGLPANMVNRLSFSEGKIRSRIQALDKIRALADPVGQVFDAGRRANGLEVMRVRVPLGVILMIYEARPHVTVNAGAFCLKSGNAAILRGGSEAQQCNELLGGLWAEALAEAGLPGECVQVITGSHEEIAELLGLEEFIDLVIPRGGKALIEAVSKKSKIPVVKHYSGVCHVYLDDSADVDSGIAIALDSKCLMPEVCNAMETLLVSEKLGEQVPRIVRAFADCGVKVKGCEKTLRLTEGVEPATEQDWRREYLDNIVSVRVVSGVDQAIEHINRYGSHHTDAIVTNSIAAADKFTEQVDSGVVLVNTSTMFCDGESLGMGAEIGISTDKLHARGPMGLQELTSYKFVIKGTGQVMGQPENFRKTKR